MELIVDLKELGWDQNLSKISNEDDTNNIIPGRISTHSGKHYVVITQDGEHKAIISNSFLKSINQKSDIPTVGDWVGLEVNPEINTNHIRFVFPRKNKLSRKVAGTKSEEQIIASNIDIVFIMTSADSDFNVRRLERYLSMVYEINAHPIIVINKIDKTNDFEKYKTKAEKICRDVPIITISAKEGKGIEEISKYTKIGKTIVLVGSSGVGKSTLINYLLGYSRQAVGEIRKSDDKGRHITTSRELIILPNGGIIIDNPGIRELQLWSSGEGISKLFSDIEEISKLCKFKDCSHEHEPGCAVKKAVEEGTITIERLNSYKKLLREKDHLSLRRDIYKKRKKDKKLAKMYRTGHDIRRYKGEK